MPPTPNDVVYVKVNDIYCYIPEDEDIIEAIIASGLHINGFRNMGGRDYGFGNFLMSRADADTLSDKNDITVTITDGHQTVTISNLLMESTKSLWPTDGANDAILVKLVDYRFLSQKSERRLDYDVFPPHPKFAPDPSAATTIEDAIQDLWFDSNIYATPVLQGTQDYPNIMIRDAQIPNSGSSYDLMNDVLNLLSHGLYKTEQGFSVFKNSYTSGINSSLVNSNVARRLGEQQNQASDICDLPKRNRVKFRQLDNSIVNNHLEFTFNYAGSEPVLPDVTKDIFVYNIYDPNHTGAVTYSAQLQSLGNQISDLFFESFPNDKKNNAVYFGVIPFEPCPDAHLIEYYHDVTDGVYKTLVKSIDVGQEFPDFSRELQVLYTFHHQFAYLPFGISAAFRVPASDVWIPSSVASQRIFEVDQFTGWILDSGETRTIYNSEEDSYGAGLYRIEHINGRWFVDPSGGTGGQIVVHAFAYIEPYEFELKGIPHAVDNGDSTFTPGELADVPIYTYNGSDIVDLGITSTIYNSDVFTDITPGLHRVELIDNKWFVDQAAVYDLFVLVPDGGIDPAEKVDGPPISFTVSKASGEIYILDYNSDTIIPFGDPPETLTFYNYTTSHLEQMSLVPVAWMNYTWVARPPGQPSGSKIVVKSLDDTLGHLPSDVAEDCEVLYALGDDPGTPVEIYNPRNMPGVAVWAEFSSQNARWEVTQGQTRFLVWAIDPNGISARVGLVPGTGQVRIVEFDKGQNKYILTTRELTVRNFAKTKTLRAGSRLGVVVWIDDIQDNPFVNDPENGYWQVIAVDNSDYTDPIFSGE